MVEIDTSLQRKRLPAAVFRLGWVSLFTDVATEMSYPLLPAFLATMGAAGQWLGIVEGVAESVSAFVKYMVGAASDRAPVRKPFVVFGYTLSSLVRPLLSVAVAPWQVVALRASDRVGKGVRSAPRDALLAAAIAPEMRAYAFGFHQMMDNIGAVIGPLIAFTLARAAHLGMRAIFAAAIVPGLIAVATLAFGVRESPAPPKPKEPTTHAGAPIDSRVKGYLAAVAIFSLGASADTFLLLRLSRQGLGVAWLPIAWLSLNAMKALTNLPGGRLADRIGHKRTLLFGWLLYAAAYGAFPLAHTVAVTWCVMLAYGFYYGLAEGAEKALLTELAPKEQRGRAFGALHAITGFAVLPANAVFGALFDAHPETAFLLGAACAALGALLLARVRVPEAD
jgi:MFS family permease